MESVDADYHRNLTWALENDVIILDLNFSLDEERFDVRETIDLIPNGRNIPVTNENKKQYVELLTQWRIIRRVSEQFQAFSTGLAELVPENLLQIFDENELEVKKK